MGMAVLGRGVRRGIPAQLPLELVRELEAVRGAGEQLRRDAVALPRQFVQLAERCRVRHAGGELGTQLSAERLGEALLDAEIRQVLGTADQIQAGREVPGTQRLASEA